MKRNPMAKKTLPKGFQYFFPEKVCLFIASVACIVNGVQLQVDLSESGLVKNAVDEFSTHKIKTHNWVIGIGVSESSTIVGAVGISNDDGFLHGRLFAVVQLEFQIKEMAGF